MRYFSKGSIIADSREDAKMLMVITSGQVTYCILERRPNLKLAFMDLSYFTEPNLKRSRHDYAMMPSVLLDTFISHGPSAEGGLSSGRGRDSNGLK